MALQCHFLHWCKPYHSITTKPLFPFLSTNFFATPKYLNSGNLKLSTHRLGRVISGVVSEEETKPVSSVSASTDVFKLTYLEGNSWLWDVSGSNILVDPILVGNLDFGIPLLYDASKRFLKKFKVLSTCSLFVCFLFWYLLFYVLWEVLSLFSEELIRMWGACLPFLTFKNNLCQNNI